MLWELWSRNYPVQSHWWWLQRFPWSDFRIVDSSSLSPEASILEGLWKTRILLEVTLLHDPSVDIGAYKLKENYMIRGRPLCSGLESIGCCLVDRHDDRIAILQRLSMRSLNPSRDVQLCEAKNCLYLFFSIKTYSSPIFSSVAFWPRGKGKLKIYYPKWSWKIVFFSKSLDVIT